MSGQAAALRKTAGQAAERLEPPFRAEHIGSLLRPRALLDARVAFARGEIAQDQLTTAEDHAIRDAIALQQQLGFRFATDGEFRRRSYHSFFYRQLGDIAIDVVDGAPISGADGNGGGRRGAQPLAKIGSRVRWTHPIHVDDFKFLAANSDLVPKITMPGPCALHFRGGDQAVTAHAYRDTDTFWSDIVEAFGRELQALAAAGCRYVQIDETAFAKFGDPQVQETLSARGDNDSVADRLFNALEIPFYFLEYDTPRAGSFTPLRLVPRGKSIILGLISSKLSALEDKDALRGRIEDATRFVDRDRLAVSPQCGFASVDTGNPITPEIQTQKLRLVVELAQEIWGAA
jgi:5-methyltetrahydropteroyltriglutamate--homocysteine methyltransferase